MEMKQKSGNFVMRRCAVPVSVFLLAVGYLVCFSAMWYTETYGSIGFDAILYTLTSELGGVDPNLIRSCLDFLFCDWLFLAFCVVVFLLCYPWKSRIMVRLFGEKTVQVYPFSPGFLVIFSLAACALLLGNAAERTSFFDYISNWSNPSTLYEEEYADPREVTITFPEKKQNLVYIFLESMETSFFSTENGGALTYNVIPELYDIAVSNINFSPTEDVGGFRAAPGTTWTIGAMVGQTAGIPLKIPFGSSQNRCVREDGSFLKGVYTLSDILHENGYQQAVMFGSKAAFGGREAFYSTHGTERIYDLYTAPEDGIVPEGYDNHFWGMEDLYLFEYAKQKLLELSAGEEPFALTLLTVDTHHVGGYLCSLCGDTYSEQYENAFRCSSTQIADFLAWIQQQDFYENTTVILAGDHLSMDEGYIARNVEKGYDRRVYNCFIHSAVQPSSMKNRGFSTFDMFPTTLAALGCAIEGDRLGLGTNLFSEKSTLLEQMGEEAFEEAISRFSQYYEVNFW